MNLMKQLTAVAVMITLVTGAGAQTFTVLKSFNPNINATGKHSIGTLALGPDGTLYGVTTDGGAGGAGVVFRVKTNGTAFTVIKSFPLINAATGTNADGATPEAGLVLSGNTLYGTTSAGGSGGNGTVFSLGTNGNNFTVLKSFSTLTDSTNCDGADPEAALIVSNGVLYGTTQYGGAGGNGTIFRVNTNGTGFTNIYSFTGNSDGANPVARLLLSGSTLYGTTLYGGDSGYGTVFSLSTNGTGFAMLHNFTGSEGQEGANPCAGLVLVESQLFGTTQYGDTDGNSDDGTVFRVDVSGNNFTNLYSFTGNDGQAPIDELLVSGLTLYGTTSMGGAGGAPYGTIFKIFTDGSNFATLMTFDYAHGWGANGAVVLSSRMFYGVTGLGGTGNSGLGNGVVYSAHTDGSGLTALAVFSDISGAADPATGLVWSGNLLFGTTENGGAAGQGTLFQIGTNGTGYAQPHEFSFPDNNGVNPDGYDPRAAMVLSAGMFYGTTRYGGTNGSGVVFRMNADGTGFTNLSSYPGGSLAALAVSGTNLYGVDNGIFKLSTNGSGRSILYTFPGGQGNTPLAGLTVSGNVLYGTTYSGGSGSGNIFQVNTDGTHFTNIYSFTGGSDGAHPASVLVLTNGVLYGTTVSGGASNAGTVFKINTDRTSFAGLHTFAGTDGSVPRDLLLSGNILYGTAAGGGTSNAGCIFKLDTAGNNFTVLYNFTGGGDGANPTESLVLLNNTLYGTTENGGLSGHGTVFSLALPSGLTPIPLNITNKNHVAVLSWSDPAFLLQASTLVTGTYTNVPNATSPYTNTFSTPTKFFRLRAN
jgi:uncharacterized repeat protein (TIGR03803 family)